MDNHRVSKTCVALAAALLLLVGASVRAADSPAVKDKERELVVILAGDSKPEQKAIACKQLAIHGTTHAVPELAKLLPDEHLNSWARTALEVIPGPTADEALRKAAKSLKGRLLVGTINSIGFRRDAGAVELLTGRLKDEDADVASAAAVALGHVGNAGATKALRQALAGSPPKVRSAVAEGCVLCAERLVSDGKATEAAEIFDEVRKAEVPKQRVLEATRGAILARKIEGIPLLVEQLRSPDRVMFRLGLTTARELEGREVGDALAGELTKATPERAALLIDAFADRDDATLPPAILSAAKNGPKDVRVAAIGVVGRLGKEDSVATLLEIATDADPDLAGGAKAALAGLSGEKVNAAIASRLDKASGKELPVLIALVGQRRIEATPALVKAIDNADGSVRSAALTALGETIGAKDLAVLIGQAISPKNPSDATVAQKALRAACVRMNDRESCAGELASAMPKASVATRANLLETLGAMGGPKALATITAAVKSGDEELQDTGSKLLGEWMTADAAPALLDLAKTAPSAKYQIRALRGYLRIARQFIMPETERAAMCDKAFEASNRSDEQKLVLEILQRYPHMDTLKVAVKAAQVPALKEDATKTASAIGQKLGPDAKDARQLLASIGVEPLKIEIVKAEFGAADKKKDVTGTIKKFVGDFGLVALPSIRYTKAFDGDPAPGVAKLLKIQYTMNGKPGEVSFTEDQPVVLPMPK